MRTPALALLLLSATAPPVLGADYLPLQIGNRWTFIAPSTAVEENRIIGTFERGGDTVFVRSYSDLGPNAGLTNFWSSEPDGGVLLWGFHRELDGFGRYYDPPLRMVDAPLTVGQTWSQTSRILDYTTGDSIDAITIGFEVSESTHLDLPAGAFDAYGIGQFSPLAGSFNLAGEVVTSARARDRLAAATPVDWWCEGVGEVQYRLSELYQLQSYDVATPVLARSWGDLKRRYR